MEVEEVQDSDEAYNHLHSETAREVFAELAGIHEAIEE